jgi:hypothetical protein
MTIILLANADREFIPCQYCSIVLLIYQLDKIFLLWTIVFLNPVVGLIKAYTFPKNHIVVDEA